MDTIKQKVQEAISKLYTKHGEVRPSALVEAARPKNAPAHDAFEWDNRKAGDEYRLIQARQWIRKVEIIVEDRPQRMVHVPQIVVEGDMVETGEGYYKPINIVSRDITEYEAALAATLAKLNAARAAYRDLKSAAAKDAKVNFRRADKGFDMVETALSM